MCCSAHWGSLTTRLNSLMYIFKHPPPSGVAAPVIVLIGVGSVTHRGQQLGPRAPARPLSRAPLSKLLTACNSMFCVSPLERRGEYILLGWPRRSDVPDRRRKQSAGNGKKISLPSPTHTHAHTRTRTSDKC